MIAKAEFFTSDDPRLTVSVRCPGCMQPATSMYLEIPDLLVTREACLSLQKCPHDPGKTMLFFLSRNKRIPETSPFQKIDFNLQNILKALEEAIACHAAKCYTASAIMIRKTLEETGYDRGAAGANLKERLKSLSTPIVLPDELFDARDDLRLRDDDAAHIKSQTYNDIGREEVKTGIVFGKEIFKAADQ